MTSAPMEPSPELSVLSSSTTTNPTSKNSHVISSSNDAETTKNRTKSDNSDKKQSETPKNINNDIQPPTVEQIQAQCSDMISILRGLEQEEHDLQCQVEILSREALLCGFQTDKVEKVLLRRPASSTTSKRVRAPSKASKPPAVNDSTIDASPVKKPKK
ncbi:hypothetical protein IV203_009169 [Nitzschia inconspicua]|uniref:Uncharacterized protein n=1 Tax=Nitzschia inconspicua TaxID=303405 RepID=A0A9K3L1J8_9STRA|nr:hypothetical protein IV203_009169 [Nitzschia inconspicua]